MMPVTLRKHFTRQCKQEALKNPDLIKDEETQKQLEEVVKKPCRSVSECSTCIRFYTEHATIKEYNKKKKAKKLSDIDIMRQQIESTAWIQCDSLACRKWRRVPAVEVDTLAEKDWFCHMNKDPDYNTCHVAEEDTDQFDKMARTVGLEYIKSEFWEGCLVWAKMPGYCSWPAVVTKGFETDSICQRQDNGEPVMYHVEYLGKTHTRGWIKRSGLRMFSDGRSEDEITKEAETLLGKKGKKKEKTTFRKGETVMMALDEAIQMIPMTCSQRLEKCIFKYTFDENPPKCKKKKTLDASGIETVNREGAIKHNEKPGKDKQNQNMKTSEEVDQSKSEDKSNLAPVPSVPGIKFDFDNSLVDKTKEERYCLDVEMYTKNEKAFEHDVLRFLMRNDVKYKGLPKMQNAPESMFQIYLAVHERGGYTEVCKKRQWMTVSREVTNTQQVGSSSNCIKNFYEKYLYPYELYIKGGDFETFFKEHGKKKAVPKKRCTTPVETMNEVNEKIVETPVSPIQLPQDNFELLSECSVDIQEMLENLEKEESFCGLEEDITAAKNKLGIDITFFDESPPVKEDARTPSEFEEADLPIEQAQEVPQFDMSDPMSDMDSNEEMIHEMQALQEGILEMVDNVLEQL